MPKNTQILKFHMYSTRCNFSIFSLTAHTTIDPLNILIPHIIHPFILSMIIYFRYQFRTIKSMLFIECSRLHRNDFFIIAWSWRERRTTIRAELAQYLSALVAAIQIQLGWPLDVLQTRLWHDDIGGKAGAGIAFAIGAVTDNDLAISVGEWGFFWLDKWIDGDK